MKPCSVGSACPTTVAAMTLAPIWLPTDPPRVRMTVFMPVATPVCSGRHRLDDEVGERGEGQADADAEDAPMPT